MKFIIIIIVALFTFGCEKKEIIYDDNTHDFINNTLYSTEVYNDVYLNDVIEIVNDEIKITSKNYKIDTTKLGKQELSVNYEYNKKKYVYHYVFDVVDTTPPLVFSGTNKTVEINSDKNMCDLITYGDNYTGNVNCEIIGEYDLSNEGTYDLVYNLSDSSNNKTSVNVILNVVSEIKNESNTEQTETQFSDIYKNYKNENIEIGIDVSKWQGDIDFEKVKNAGVSFVIIRIGSQRQSGESINIDEYYENNIKKAKDAGLKVGVYLYSTAISKAESVKQADWVIKTLNKEKLDLPIVFDWENWINWNSYKISFYDINEIANNFIHSVKESGYEGMLYSSKFYLETIWQNKKNYPVWLAHYTNNTDYKGNYEFWQLCNNGKIDGINGYADIDIMYKKNT